MTNQDERTLLAGLRVLKEYSAAEAAPERVHAVVISEFRNGPRRRAARWWAGAAVAAAACVLITVALYPRREAVQTFTIAKKRPAVLPPVRRQEVTQPAKVSVAAHGNRREGRKRATGTKPAAAAEVATDFMPVVSAPPLARGEHAAVMRVELPRSSLRAFGLSMVDEPQYQRVNADVVVGQDGLIRAVRFVK